MNQEQNLTEIEQVSEAVEKKLEGEPLLKYQQELWIDFNALGGLVINDEGGIDKMTVNEFADKLRISKTTLYEWRKSIPFFWDKVGERRKVLGSQARTTKVYNGLFLKGAAGNPQAAALFLANHDPNFRMPSQQVEHSAGDGFSDLVAAMKNAKDKQKAKPIEAEVIDVDNQQSNT